MEEEIIAIPDPDEMGANIDDGAIHDDWNSQPDDKLGVDDQVDDGNDPSDEDAADKDSTDATGKKADQSFTLKHMGAVKTVGRDEVVVLAQKGMDYDRIRGKYDEAQSALNQNNEAIEVLRDMAELSGMTTNELIKATRTQLMTKQAGNDRLRSQREADNQANPDNEDPNIQRRQKEISEFITEYGTSVDPTAIPSEVWQSVAKGKTLLSAYQAWELKKLRAENNAAGKTSENKGKSVGSRKTAGSGWRRDAIAADWYDS